jgi:hypothetical protein
MATQSADESGTTPVQIDTSSNGGVLAQARVLMCPSFVNEHTDFETFKEMCCASPFRLLTDRDFENVDPGEWDAYVALTTEFETWSQMLDAARIAAEAREAFHALSPPGT